VLLPHTHTYRRQMNHEAVATAASDSQMAGYGMCR
jgi:hypothetical protein